MGKQHPLYRLPEEIIEIIISDFIYFEGIHKTKNMMKSLRLAHPRFANSSAISNRLFEVLIVRAISEHSDILRKGELINRVAPIAKKVIFEPVQCSWATTYEQFREIVVLQALYDCEIQQKSKLCLGKTFEEHREALLGQFAAERVPFLQQDLELGFEAYQARANAIKTLFDTGELEGLWTSFLQSLPFVDTVQIGRYPLNEDEMDEMEKLNVSTHLKCQIGGHSHDNIHPLSTCQELAAPVTNELVLTVAGCLNRVSPKVKTLKIKCIFGYEFSFKDDPRWANLSLAGIERLHWKPKNQLPGWINDVNVWGGSKIRKPRSTL
jgi:hypothetical protein